jgi:hypothetical protein
MFFTAHYLLVAIDKIGNACQPQLDRKNSQKKEGLGGQALASAIADAGDQ